ncbi:MAG: GNAT family N-acetyltransferase [Lyngbya sp. HA4199-MV5]|nr:GNAT family N-acetyltransferase [Lyngbya sp. HA4199-MV5]
MTAEVIRLTQPQLDHAVDINNAVETLALAFDNDPIFCFLWNGNKAERLKRICWFSNLLLRYSLPDNYVYTTPHSQGVAIWLSPGHYPLNEWRLLQLGLYTLPFQLRLNRFWQALHLFDQIEKYHKQDMPTPHWYLFMLGVHPSCQGEGIGGLLLQPVLQQADADQLCCYLETSTERAVRFYEKHGFKVVRSHENSATALPFWTMRRLPKPMTYRINL